jgi:hypothetical protein
MIDTSQPQLPRFRCNGIQPHLSALLPFLDCRDKQGGPVCLRNLHVIRDTAPKSLVFIPLTATHACF